MKKYGVCGDSGRGWRTGEVERKIANWTPKLVVRFVKNEL
jgi:hypothetical protein